MLPPCERPAKAFGRAGTWASCRAAKRTRAVRACVAQSGQRHRGPGRQGLL